MQSVFARCVCAVIALTAAAGSAAAAAPPKVHPRPFGRGLARYHKTEAAPYRFKNEIIKINVDFAKRAISAQTTNVVYPKSDGLTTVPFDSVGLHYSAIKVNGAPAKFRTSADHLYVDLPTPAKATDELKIVADYTANPVRGVYFIAPDAKYRRMQPQVWTQGEMEDNRRWYPTWDEPNEKSPSELIVSVPHGWRVIGNGALVAHSDDGKAATWDWNEPKPHSTYLTAFSGGPYVKLHDTLGQLPVDYYVSPADAKWGRACFGRTPQMIAFFQERIGIPFPWEKYAQTTVERFTAGGMENASATTQTEFAIHDPRYDLETPCDGLVSHELAHQWWGDDVTTPDWPNIWINEGYATYFEELWMGHHYGEAQFAYERYHAQQDYFTETKRYWRPIVDYNYGGAGDSFDASGYQRPGQVLHMLRYVLGERAFWKALHDYLAEYQYKTADTRQFEAAVEKSSGRALKWFFDEWFYRPAYPNFIVAQTYDAKSRTLTLDVRQRNHDGKPFRMPVDVSVVVAGHTVTNRFTASRQHQTFQIHGVGQPQMVLFDPNNNVLRKLTFKKGVAGLAYQATRAPSIPDRLWAIDQLANARKSEHSAAAAALRFAIAHDPFYGVRVDALDAAASLDDAAGVRVGLDDPDPRVVIAAGKEIESLDHPRNEMLQRRLAQLTNSDNAMIAGAALRGLGASKMRGVYAILMLAYKRHVFREFVARGADLGLANLGDLRALATLEQRASYGMDESERPDAIAAIGTLTKKKPELARQFLLAIATGDPYFRARTAAARTLGKLGDEAAIAGLQRVQTSDPEEGVRRAAWDAVADIRDSLKERRGRRK